MRAGRWRLDRSPPLPSQRPAPLTPSPPRTASALSTAAAAPTKPLQLQGLQTSRTSPSGSRTLLSSSIKRRDGPWLKRSANEATCGALLDLHAPRRHRRRQGAGDDAPSEALEPPEDRARSSVLSCAGPRSHLPSSRASSVESEIRRQGASCERRDGCRPVRREQSNRGRRALPLAGGQAPRRTTAGPTVAPREERRPQLTDHRGDTVNDHTIRDSSETCISTETPPRLRWGGI